MAGRKAKHAEKANRIAAPKAATRSKTRKNPLKPYQLPQRPMMQFISTYTRPAPQDLPVPEIRPVIQDKECSGNFRVHDFPDDPMQLWMLSRHVQAALCQISVYNSPSSTGSVEVLISGGEHTAFIVHPGNTGTFSGADVRKVSIRFKEGNNSFIEGRYCISSSIWLNRCHGPEEDCNWG